VTTEEEVFEAFSLARRSQPSILRLQLTEKEEASSTKEEERLPHSAHHLPPWARRGFFRHHHQHQQGEEGQGGEEQNGCPMRRRHCGGGGGGGGWRRWARQEVPEDVSGQATTLNDPRHAHPLQLTANPYGHGHFVCDGCQLSGHGHSYHCATCQYDLHVSCKRARETARPWERRRLWFGLHNQALNLMEKPTAENLSKAKELLQEQLDVTHRRTHRATPLYNLACCSSLSGEVEAALKYLEEAISAGWRDVQHTETDKDFEKIRHLDAFKALLVSMKAAVKEEAEANEEEEENGEDEIEIEVTVQPSAPVAAFESKPSAPPVSPSASNGSATPVVVPLSPIYPVLPPSSEASAPVMTQSSSIAEFDAKLKTLEQMGFMDRRKNITILVRSRGDLVSAIQQLLEDGQQH